MPFGILPRVVASLWRATPQFYGIRKDSPKLGESHILNMSFLISWRIVRATSKMPFGILPRVVASLGRATPQFHGIRKDSPKTWRVPHTEYVFSYLLENCGARRAAFNPYFFLSFMRESLVKKPDFFKIGRKSLSISQSALAIP